MAAYRFLALAPSVASLFILGCSPMASSGTDDANSNGLVIEGSLTYRQRIALPADSQMVVELRDTSPGGAVLAEDRRMLGGAQVPLPFSLTVERRKLRPNRAYAVHGTVTQGGRTLWDSGSVIIDAGADRLDLGPLNLTQDLSDPSATAAIPPGGAPTLEGAEWVVQTLDGQAPVDRSRMTFNFGADGKVSGKASCNSYSGLYEATGDTLRIGRAAATMMACLPEVDAQERRFFDLLPELENYEITTDETLILRTADGRQIRAVRP